MAVQEASESFVDLVKCNTEIVDEVHRDMVAISTTVLNVDDFKGVKDGTNKTLCLGDEELGRSHIAGEATRADQGANEESIVKLVLASDSVIDVDLAVVGEARGNVIVGKAAELELVSQSWFDVTNGRLFAPTPAHVTEGEVNRVLAFAADEIGYTAYTMGIEHILRFIGEGDKFLPPGVVRHVPGLIKSAERDVNHVRRLSVRTIGRLE